MKAKKYICICRWTEGYHWCRCCWRVFALCTPQGFNFSDLIKLSRSNKKKKNVFERTRRDDGMAPKKSFIFWSNNHTRKIENASHLLLLTFIHLQLDDFVIGLVVVVVVVERTLFVCALRCVCARCFNYLRIMVNSSKAKAIKYNMQACEWLTDCVSDVCRSNLKHLDEIKLLPDISRRTESGNSWRTHKTEKERSCWRSRQNKWPTVPLPVLVSCWCHVPCDSNFEGDVIFYLTFFFFIYCDFGVFPFDFSISTSRPTHSRPTLGVQSFHFDAMRFHPVDVVTLRHLKSWISFRLIVLGACVVDFFRYIYPLHIRISRVRPFFLLFCDENNFQMDGHTHAVRSHSPSNTYVSLPFVQYTTTHVRTNSIVRRGTSSSISYILILLLYFAFVSFLLFSPLRFRFNSFGCGWEWWNEWFSCSHIV